MPRAEGRISIFVSGYTGTKGGSHPEGKQVTFGDLTNLIDSALEHNTPVVGSIRNPNPRIAAFRRKAAWFREKKER